MHKYMLKFIIYYFKTVNLTAIQIATPNEIFALYYSGVFSPKKLSPLNTLNPRFSSHCHITFLLCSHSGLYSHYDLNNLALKTGS